MPPTSGAPTLSAVVITENEADIIDECLSHLAFCDETVLIDGGSIDGTLEKARHFRNVKAISHPSATMGIHYNKNLGAEKSSGEWILSIDADEIVSAELADEIRRVISNPAHACYKVRRKTYFLGKWIEHCGWWPGEVVRLWKRGHTEWPLEVHLTPDAKGDCGMLEVPLDHYSYRSISEWIQKVDHFSGCEAVELDRTHGAQGNGALLRGVTIDPLLAFARKIVFHAAWKDGLHGIIIAGSAAFALWLRNVKRWEMKITGRKPPLGGRQGRKA